MNPYDVRNKQAELRKVMDIDPAFTDPAGWAKGDYHKKKLIDDWGIYGDCLKSLQKLPVILLAIVMAICDSIYAGFICFGKQLKHYLEKEQ